MNITYFECVFIALAIQHSVRMRCFVICVLPGSTVFFHNISYKARFRGGGGVIERKMYVLIFRTNLSETFLILRIERDVIKSLYRSLYKVPVVLMRFS
jgi:hypothetical protein